MSVLLATLINMQRCKNLPILQFFCYIFATILAVLSLGKPFGSSAIDTPFIF